MHELQGKISIYVYASGGKTARVVVQILLIVVFFSGVSGGGVGGVITSMLTPSWSLRL